MLEMLAIVKSFSRFNFQIAIFYRNYLKRILNNGHAEQDYLIFSEQKNILSYDRNKIVIFK